MSPPTAPVRPARLLAPPTGSWPVPGPKSLTNRALVLAALAQGTSFLDGALTSDDTERMAEGLSALGVPVERIDEERLLVRGGRAQLRAPTEPLFVGNSGT
ncbi:MAG: 3-phosphoshikimate 1-carboxyvinyltransferase, partial [Planctomycetota bacterium]